MQKTRREVRNFTGSSWENGNGRRTEPVYDPATGEVIAETSPSTKEDIDRAVEAASAAFPGWSATPVIGRTRILFRYKMRSGSSRRTRSRSRATSPSPAPQ